MRLKNLTILFLLLTSCQSNSDYVSNILIREFVTQELNVENQNTYFLLIIRPENCGSCLDSTLCFLNTYLKNNFVVVSNSKSDKIGAITYKFISDNVLNRYGFFAPNNEFIVVHDQKIVDYYALEASTFTLIKQKILDKYALT